MSQTNDYGSIADLYDTYVPVDFDIPFFLFEAQKSMGEVLELMSGTGRVSLPLIQAGVRLTCVDRSPEMLAVLQKKLDEKGLAAELVTSDVRELSLGKSFDLIFIPFHSFSEIVSVDDERTVLMRIRQHLKPKGRFICTLRNPAAGGHPDGWPQLFSKHSLGERGTLLFWMLGRMSEQDNRVVDAIEFFEEYERSGFMRGRRMLELTYRLISRQEFKGLAESTGFEVEALHGDYEYAEFDESTSPYMIWELKSH